MRLTFLLTVMLLFSANLIAREKTNKNMKIAKQAFAAWEKGENSGDYGDFKAMLSPNFAFYSHPLRPGRGVYKGKEAFLKTNTLIEEREKAPNNLKFSNILVTSGDNTFVFQFDSEGKVGGHDYKGWNTISLTIENGKITGFREYFGDVEPAWFKP